MKGSPSLFYVCYHFNSQFVRKKIFTLVNDTLVQVIIYLQKQSTQQTMLIYNYNKTYKQINTITH